MAAFAAGVGITFAFSIALLGWNQSLDAWRDQRTLPMVLWGTMAVIEMVCVLTGIVLGIIIMTDK